METINKIIDQWPTVLFYFGLAVFWVWLVKLIILEAYKLWNGES